MPTSHESAKDKKQTLVVFTYAPTGFGHIRVADALMAGTPASFNKTVFSPSDTSIESIHRLMSLNVIVRHFAEWVQRGAPQVAFTRNYRTFLKKNAEKLILEFSSLIRSQEEKPDKVVIVSTHFGLAHQLGFIKKRLENLLDIQITLVVQVTDDSPQFIWYVDTADLIIVPSAGTKKELERYARKEKLPQVDIEVAPYPIISTFAKTLNSKEQTDRALQYDPDHTSPINIAIPVSGAAVGMQFFLHLMQWLNNRSPRFVFHVLCRKAPFTKKFIEQVSKREYVNLYVSDSYSEMVRMYNAVYENNVISAEMTKPSEQSFKALLHNTSVGGSFLFFAHPVGRQEYDNLKFLKKHGFLSKDSDHLRGLLLPQGSRAAADFIWSRYNDGTLLESFNNFVPCESSLEIGDYGVEEFWDLVRARN